jgi:hypothetical protein
LGIGIFFFSNSARKPAIVTAGFEVLPKRILEQYHKTVGYCFLPISSFTIITPFDETFSATIHMVQGYPKSIFKQPVKKVSMEPNGKGKVKVKVKLPLCSP